MASSLSTIAAFRLLVRSGILPVLKPKQQRLPLKLNVFRSFVQPLKKAFQIKDSTPASRAPLAILLPVVMAASGDNKELVTEVDALHEKKEFEKIFELLIPHKDTTDADVLWRLARAATDVGKARGGDERKTFIFDAFAYIKRALELDDKNFACHKWYGILLDYTAEYEGTKQRISNAFKVKEAFEKAIELNPKDATTMYCLGTWCFLFADMAWYQRKIAAVIFGNPPTSTYDEALGFFKRAESADPGFFNKNKVMIGKTYLRMKDKEQAKDFLLEALKHEDKTVDDTEARKECVDLLKELGVKV